MTKKITTRAGAFLCLLLCAFTCFSCFLPRLSVQAEQVADLTIATKKDLFDFAARVNAGETFENKRVTQTADIDLGGDLFTPIGAYGKGNYFYGVYDGQGHVISNLTITKECGTSNNGLFGHLGGTVMNLGLVSGKISGACCGSFASHAASTSAAIVNCFSSLSLSCARTGGIADNFIGAITNCVYYHPSQNYAAVGYHAASIYHTYAKGALPKSFKGYNEGYRSLSDVPGAALAKEMNGYRQTAFLKLNLPSGTRLYEWKCENGTLSFTRNSVGKPKPLSAASLKANLPLIVIGAVALLSVAAVGVCAFCYQRKEDSDRD